MAYSVHGASHSSLPFSEEWRPVVGYEGWYEVSNLGRVKRVKGGRGAQVGFILNPYLMVIGYHTVTLSMNSSHARQEKYVHDLVAAAFLGPRPPGHEVNHKDLNKARSHADNLEYLTHAENVNHARKLGMFPIGERNGQAKLTEEEVKNIRALHGVVTTRELAKLYKVGHGTISLIQTRKLWSHLP